MKKNNHERRLEHQNRQSEKEMKPKTGYGDKKLEGPNQPAD
jgi:hypothetical protein